jgi:hypothetical protein
MTLKGMDLLATSPNFICINRLESDAWTNFSSNNQMREWDSDLRGSILWILMQKLYFAFDFVLFAFTLWCARSCLLFSSSSVLVLVVRQASIPLPQFRCYHKALACRCLLEILIHFSTALSAHWSPVLLFSVLATGDGLLCLFLLDLILPLRPEIWVPIFLFGLMSRCIGQEHVRSASISNPVALSSVRVRAWVPALESVLFHLWIFHVKAVDFPLVVLLAHVRLDFVFRPGFGRHLILTLPWLAHPFPYRSDFSGASGLVSAHEHKRSVRSCFCLRFPARRSIA